MFELQRLRPDHEAALLEFEVANRDYFAETISDRGDAFFEHFAEQHAALLTEQEAGIGAYYLLFDEEAAIVGRFNLYRFENGTADVGYRIAQRVSGRGVATGGLRSLCSVAREQHGLRTLRAAVSHQNVASQRVLAKAGFVAVGPAEFEGRRGVWYELALTAV